MCDGLSEGGYGKPSSSQGCGDTSDMRNDIWCQQWGWAGVNPVTSVGKGMDSLQLAGVHSFPQFSNTEDLFSPRGPAMLLHPSNFPQHSTSSTQPHWVGWSGVVTMEMDFFCQPLYLTNQQILLLNFSFPASFVVSSPEVWD